MDASTRWARSLARSAQPEPGQGVIRAYLGGGDPDEAKRAERQIHEAIGALKQSGNH
jgi:hypothetical protein